MVQGYHSQTLLKSSIYNRARYSHLVGSVNRARFAARVHHWKAESIEKVRAFATVREPEPESTSQSNQYGDGSDRRAAVDAFLRACNQESNLETVLIRKHIWLAVKHANGRQFQYWQSCNPKATGQNDQDFRRILAMNPVDFVSLVKKMNIF